MIVSDPSQKCDEKNVWKNKLIRGVIISYFPIVYWTLNQTKNQPFSPTKKTRRNLNRKSVKSIRGKRGKKIPKIESSFFLGSNIIKN